MLLVSRGDATLLARQLVSLASQRGRALERKLRLAIVAAAANRRRTQLALLSPSLATASLSFVAVAGGR